MTSTDYLIIGQGLAGTVLGWRLLERGVPVQILDREEAATSSKVAAGIMTPITGQRMAKTWRIETLWPCARDFYRQLEERLGERFFFETPIVRIFSCQAEVEKWEKKKEWEGFGQYVARSGQDLGLADGITAPLGGFEMKNCGFVDVKRFLGESRNWFMREGMYKAGEFDEEKVQAEAGGGARYGDLRVRGKIILCTGFAAHGSRFFDWVPFKAAKGEILEVELEGMEEETRILNRGNWLLPRGGGLFRTGTTYEWEHLDTVPTPAARREIEGRLRGMTGAAYRVTGHAAAVRPIIRESRVLMGQHPGAEWLGFFNGLGSKGVLNAPYFADQLAGFLVGTGEIEEEVDLLKNM